VPPPPLHKNKCPYRGSADGEARRDPGEEGAGSIQEAQRGRKEECGSLHAERRSLENTRKKVIEEEPCHRPTDSKGVTGGKTGMNRHEMDRTQRKC